MTPSSNNDELNDGILPDDIVDLLRDEATWTPVSNDMEDSIVAAVMAEIDLADTDLADTDLVDTDLADTDLVDTDLVDTDLADTDLVDTAPAPAAAAVATPVPDVLPDNVVSMPSRWKTAALGAAAALLVVAGLFGVTQLGSESPDIEIALAGTDLAPLASAEAEITETPEGTRIVISVDELPPAAPGTYYQAWLRKDAEIGVSAGTFHLRDGNGPIELWAGVTTDDYPLLTVTLQQEAQTESSGQVVLKALIDGS